jgi:hypothetical protein
MGIVCKKCWVERHEDEFYDQGGAMKHKKRSHCKPCFRAPDGYLKEYRRRRYATDPAFRVLQLSRCRLNAALKGKAKSAHTRDLLGCTPEELVGYLKELIPENADLKDFHIDHIRPCASFDFTDPGEIEKCFHYTNLQPLSPQANMSKGAKY